MYINIYTCIYVYKNTYPPPIGAGRRGQGPRRDHRVRRAGRRVSIRCVRGDIRLWEYIYIFIDVYTYKYININMYMYMKTIKYLYM